MKVHIYTDQMKAHEEARRMTREHCANFTVCSRLDKDWNRTGEYAVKRYT